MALVAIAMFFLLLRNAVLSESFTERIAGESRAA
jgi:hypothetical protein